ncbi:MAG: phenylalanine--tRNA ligase subunit beta [Thermoplasmatales archaeon]|nr:phenylalanine--tRNA ligase subunit beta [Thermoplasmatales archaeon]MCW6170023.1 phenylalanine--tRNA ligase subunit beta [Thermoplasmatales archaeon]
MVVIREDISDLKRRFGENASNELTWFSGIIGFSIDVTSDAIKIELNPDRPDLYSFSTMFDAIRTFKNPENLSGIAMKPPPVSLHVSDKALKLRRYILCFWANGSTLGDRFNEIIDYQEKLHQTIGKNRSKFAIGIHDLRNLKPPFRYISAGLNEISFTTYDEKITGTPEDILNGHELGKEFGHLIPDRDYVPLILDSDDNVLSMPPIVNGNASKISEMTSDIFVDITGNDWPSTRSAYYLVANYLNSIGFKLHKAEQDGGYRKDLHTYNDRKVLISRAEVEGVLGTRLTNTETSSALKRMGYVVEENPRGFSVFVKGSRIDVMGPVDVIEDIGKAYGYDNIASRKPQLSTIGSTSKESEWKDGIRELLVGFGLQEIQTFFLSPSVYYQGVNYYGDVEVINPKSLDYSIPRDRLIFGMLDFFRLNKRRKLPQETFEIGKVVIHMGEKTHLCIGLTNSKAGFSEIKRIVDPFLSRLNIQRTDITQTSYYGFIQGRTGSLSVGGKEIGLIGEIHPALLEKFELVNPVAMAELDLDSIIQ